MRTLLYGCSLGIGALWPALAAAQPISVTQRYPYEFGDSFRFETSLKNNTGVTLDTYALDYSVLLTTVANLPWNIPRFDQDGNGVVELIADNAIAQMSSDMGVSVWDGVDSGWSGSMENDGTVSFTNNGIIPGVTYIIFSTGLTAQTRLIVGEFLIRNPDTLQLTGFALTSGAVSDFAWVEKIH